ncbi:tape measure protein [Prosthecomicrobium hirschii]|uniref:tape measure protein n=1 Tax=Prosthecodimorpha hirschii TaxID=665126 RepID=UPI0022208C8C|nr:tape measure protein [Prosthecomicrobium hirschii]MCW1844121.1 tape measure protein [Prosthecomicrobium hirschii]
MAAQVGSIYASLTADFGQYGQAIQEAARTTEQGTGRIRSAMGLTERSVTALERTMGSGLRFNTGQVLSASRAFESVGERVNFLRSIILGTTAVFGGLAAALTTNVVARYADSFVNLTNQIRAVSASSAEARAATLGVAQVAEASRASLSATATLYSRIQKAAPNESSDNVLRYVETIQKALQLGGATAQEATSAAIQFSQAIASDRLQGEELRAILETPLGGELAKGLGVTIGKLREMGSEGELTAKVVLGGLSKAAPVIDRQWAGMATTIDQALTVADNKLTLYFGSVNESFGGTRLLAQAINGFADNLKIIIPLLTQAGILIGSIFAGRLAGGFADRTSAGIGSIRASIQARKEDVAAAREQVAASRAALQAAESNRSNLSLQRTFGGDSRFADTGALKAYQQEVARITKLDQERIGLLERQRQIQAETITGLAAVSREISPKAAAMADRQAKAEDSLNAALSRQAELRRQITQADTRITAAAGMQATSTGSISALSEATRQKASLERGLAQAEADAARQREVIARQMAGIAGLQTEADRKAAEARLAIKRNEMDATRALNDAMVANERARATTVGNLRRGSSALETSGRDNFSDQMRRASDEVARLAPAIGTAETQLTAMQRAASTTGVMLSGLRTVGASLVGFLGGPWGVAFTTASIAMAYFGSRALEAAEKTRQAQEIISREVGKLASEGSISARRSQVVEAIDQKKKELESVQAELTRLQQGLAQQATTSLSGIFSKQNAVPVETQRQIFDLIASLRSGQISVAQFGEAMNGLALPAQVISRINAEVDKIQEPANRAREAIAKIGLDLDGLNQKRVQVFIDVISTRRQNDAGGDRQSAADIINASAASTFPPNYAAAANGSLQAMEAAKSKASELADVMQQRLARASGDAEQSIKDLAQSLLDSYGRYGMTKTAAEAQARAEYAAQQARRGNIASMREQNSLQQRLAALQEQAAGSFLSETDRKVLQDMKSLKMAADEMERFRRAAEGGNYSGLSRNTQDLLQAERIKAAADSYRELVTQYGNMNQITPMLNDKQAQLNYLVQSGKITADQARLAMGEYAMSFTTIGQTVSLASDFTKSFVDGMIQGQTAAESFANALRSLATRLADILIDTMFRRLVGSMIMGTTGVPGTVTGSLFHEGGLVGAGGPTRSVPASAYSGAPRYHSGFMPGELPAILKQGEAVLNDNLTGRVGRVMAGLTDMAGGGVTSVTINNDNRGVDAGQVTRLEGMMVNMQQQIKALQGGPVASVRGTGR